MKVLITILIGLLVVGCGKKQSTNTNESAPTTTEKPVKELTAEEKQKALRDSVVGEYEWKKESGLTLKWVFLANGDLKSTMNISGESHEIKWKIMNREIHTYDRGFIGVYRINADKSITCFAKIIGEKRFDLRIGSQNTFKKIK